MPVSKAEEHSVLLNNHSSDDPSAKLVADSRFGADQKKKKKKNCGRSKEKVTVTAALEGEKIP